VLGVKVLAAAFILTLLFSAVALLQFVSLGSANPYDGDPVPPSLQTPNKDPPVVTIQSPLNATYSENEVLLNFTVTQPDSWFKEDVACWIKNISYQLDGGQVVTLFEPTPSLSELPATKQFSIVLRGVIGGQHNLQVNVSAESQYCPSETYYFFLLERYPLDVSHTVVFNVEPSPTTLVVVTVVAIVATGSGLSAAYYLRKRKNNKHSSPP
jgi:hypothetical protein